MIDVTQRDS